MFEYFKRESNGLTDLNIDFDTANDRVILQPEGTTAFKVNRIIISISDDDSDYNLFGNIDLSSGAGLVFLKEYKRPASPEPVTMQNLFGEAMKSTRQLTRMGQLQPPLNSGGLTKLTKIIGTYEQPIILYGRHYQRIAIPMTDDLQLLEEFTIQADIEEFIYG